MKKKQMTSGLPSPVSWALTAGNRATATDAWREFYNCLQQLGFANPSYLHEAERFERRVPSPDKTFGHLVSPKFMEGIRNDPVINQVGFKVPVAASFGMEVSVIPELELGRSDLDPMDRQAVGWMKDLGLLGGWGFSLANRKSNTYSVLLLDCQYGLAEQKQLIDLHSNYLQACCAYFTEGLIVRALREDAGPNLLSARETDCLAYTAAGLSSKEIADQLAIATSTVNEYINSAQRKLKARNRTQATARAVLLGVIAP